MLQTWQDSQNKSKTLASKANKTMNSSSSSFQDYYFQPHPPPTSTQPDHPTTHHAKEEADVVMASASKKKGGVRLSTDPQSVAARERRHRISHRLKTLQSLVPGAAKLDTVSLLDHAIHYVHFLNSQIRFHQLLLLSNGHYDYVYDYDCSDVANYDPRFLQVVDRHDQCLGFVGPAPAPAALPPPDPVQEEACFWVID